MKRFLPIFAIAGTALFLLANDALAQRPVPVNTTVQLPVVSFFNIRTVVSAPDGGTMSLGGVGRSASGRSSVGHPWFGRPFRNTGIGSFNSASRGGVSARIIINSEIEQAVLADADRIERRRELSDPNGTRDVQSKADFISRNIGSGR